MSRQLEPIWGNVSPREREDFQTRLSYYRRVIDRPGFSFGKSWGVTRARQVIAQFALDHPDAILSVSWGKDSVAVASLLATVPEAEHVKLVWVPSIREDGTSYEMPDTYRVRDQFLLNHPTLRYEERPCVMRAPKRGEKGWEEHIKSGARGQDALAENISEPHITGLRGDESRIRRISLAARGFITKNTCRPIGRWSDNQVFEWLLYRDEPIHTAYAATLHGTLKPSQLRVHALRSTPMFMRNNVDAMLRSHAWEDHYFPTLIEHQPWKGEQ